MGISATALVDICDIWYRADQKGALKNRENAKIAAKNAYTIFKEFSNVGITALVDEATGYQYDREKVAFQKILKHYINEELFPWKKRFPDEFYREIFRLQGWNFTVSQIKKGARPGVIGRWIKKYIYSVLPKGILDSLIKLTPINHKGKLKQKLHQHLTKEQGIEHLNKQLVCVVTLMNISNNWQEFNKYWNKKFGQPELEFTDFQILEPKKEMSTFDKSQKHL